MNIRRVLAFCAALALSIPAAAQQRIDSSKQQPKRNAQEQYDFAALLKAVDDVSAGQAAPADIPLTLEGNHFMKGQNNATYIPFTVIVDRSKLTAPAAVLYVRAMKKGEAPAPPAAKGKDKDKNASTAVTYPWENLQQIEVPADGKVSRAMLVAPGEYNFYFAVKEKSVGKPSAAAGAKVGVLRRELTVPDFNKQELTISSVILAQGMEPAEAVRVEQQGDNPYVFGTMRVIPSVDGKFGKNNELSLIYWIYGTGSSSTGKPDIQVDYSFHQKTAEGEKYFNKTPPQLINATTLPPDFSSAAGHQLTGSLSVPLTSFPAGDYRVEIKITDKATGKDLTQNVNFTVAAS